MLCAPGRTVPLESPWVIAAKPAPRTINPLAGQVGVLPAGGGANIPQELRIGGCQRLDYRCEISTAVTVLVAIIVACFIG